MKIVDDPSPRPESSTAAAANNGQYDIMLPWDADRNATIYDAPVGSWEAMAIQQATAVITMPRPQVQRLVRPPLPQIGPRGVRHNAVPDVEEVITMSRDLYMDRRSFFSGSEGGYQGSTRNEWGSAY